MDSKKNKIVVMLKEYKKKISNKAKIEKMLLFGSQAKGVSKEGSDVDILLISSDFERKKYFQRSPQFYLLWNYDYDVDIICLTPKEYKERKQQIGVIQEVEKYGIEI